MVRCQNTRHANEYPATMVSLQLLQMEMLICVVQQNLFMPQGTEWGELYEWAWNNPPQLNMPLINCEIFSIIISFCSIYTHKHITLPRNMHRHIIPIAIATSDISLLRICLLYYQPKTIWPSVNVCLPNAWLCSPQPYLLDAKVASLDSHRKYLRYTKTIALSFSNTNTCVVGVFQWNLI